MSTSFDRLDETVIVRIGVLGAADEGIGSAHATRELSGSPQERSEQVGETIAEAARIAYMEAVHELHPILLQHFRTNRQADQGNADS